MADVDTLKSFLVALGFKIDESAHNRFHAAIHAAEIDVGKLGLAVTSVSTALVEGLRRITDQFSQLYLLSQNTGVAVQGLESLRYAAHQAGVSTGGMAAAIERMRVITLNPLTRGAVARLLGVDPKSMTDAKTGIDDLVKHFSGMFRAGGMARAMAESQLQSLGFDPNALAPAMLNPDQFFGDEQKFDKRTAAIHLDMQKLADDARKFTLAFGELITEAKRAGEKFASDWVEPATAGLKALTGYLEKFDDEMAKLPDATRKWGELTTAIGLTGGALAVALTTARLLARALGLGGKAAAPVMLPPAGAEAAGGAAGGAAAAGGSRLLGLLGLLGGAAGGHELYEDAQRRARATGESPWRAGAEELLLPRWLLRGGAGQGGAGQGSGGLLHHESYQLPDTGYGRNPLLQDASYSPGDNDVSGDLRDWLHGSAAFIPMVRLPDLGLGDGSAASPGTAGQAAAGGGSGGAAPGAMGPFLPGGKPGPTGDAQRQLVKNLYLHALTPVSSGGLGLDQAHATAMLGNVFAESGFNPAALSPGGDYGLFQWNQGRLTALRSALGKNLNDPQRQFDFAVSEERRRDPNWFDRQGSVADLTNSFEATFERPARVTDRSAYSNAIPKMIDQAVLGAGDVHHHHGDQIGHQGNVSVTVHTSSDRPHDIARAVTDRHSRQWADTVRNYRSPTQ